jgi:hypothetical protein
LSVNIAIVYSIYASLLRAREFYADWRAAAWGAKEGLTTQLTFAKNREATIDFKTKIRKLFRLNYHPTPQERLDTLQAPDRLFTFKPELSLFVGWLAATILFGAIQLLSLLLNVLLKMPEFMVAQLEMLISTASDTIFTLLFIITSLGVALIVVLFFIPFVGLSLLVLKALGLEVLRETSSDLYLGKNSFAAYARRLLTPAFLLALGMHLGLATNPFGTARLGLGISVAPMILVELLAHTVFVWVCLIGLRFLGVRLLGTWTGSDYPVVRQRLLISGFSVFVSLFLVIFIGGQLFSFASDSGLAAIAAFMLWFLLVPLLGAALVSVAGFPLAWLTVEIWQRLRPARCPECTVFVRDKVALGRNCHACDAELTPWLLYYGGGIEHGT